MSCLVEGVEEGLAQITAAGEEAGLASARQAGAGEQDVHMEDGEGQVRAAFLCRC